MATEIGRLEFKQHYGDYTQGLFIMMKEKRIPKNQAEVNVGQQLSMALCDVPESERADRTPAVLADALNVHHAVTLTHPDTAMVYLADGGARRKDRSGFCRWFLYL